MAKEHKSPLPTPIWKMVAFMEFWLPEVQDTVYPNIYEVDEDYDKLKQGFVTWASTKVANEGVPMDDDRVARSYHHEEEEDYEIAAVGWRTQCCNCGGWGHQSKECPSEKSLMRARATGRATSRGARPRPRGRVATSAKAAVLRQGDKGKSSRKGYQGTCFTCGKVGHKACECLRGRPVGAVGKEEDENVPAGSLEIGTVWGVRAVEVQAAEVERMEVDEKPKMKSIDITINSGAEASCWPQELRKKVPMQPNAKGVRFRAANKAELKYHRTQNIMFQVDGGGEVCDMKFYVTAGWCSRTALARPT